jgi:DNA-binding XRE family transcriptional regulator
MPLFSYVLDICSAFNISFPDLNISESGDLLNWVISGSPSPKSYIFKCDGIDIPGTVGEVFKKRRTELKLTLRVAAKMCGVTISTLRAWESGINYPRYRSFEKTCEVYGIAKMFV